MSVFRVLKAKRIINEIRSRFDDGEKMIDLLLLKMYLTGYLNKEEIFALDFSVVNRRRVTEIIKLDIGQVEQIFYELESKFEQEENNLEGDIENE